MREFLRRFWRWYERHYALNVGIAAGLFVLQAIHFVWLTAHVVAGRLFGASFFDLGGFWESVVVLVDYTEIPSLISVSLVYVNDLRKRFDLKSAVYLIFLNSQWPHLFWITDEFVLAAIHRGGTILPPFLAWIAISIEPISKPHFCDLHPISAPPSLLLLAVPHGVRLLGSHEIG